MTTMTLDDSNRQLLADELSEGDWMVACLCAEWCDVCTQYRPGFLELAASWPRARFVWIDVEDQAALVGDYDVENFPTLLIQRGETVVFYGPTLPEPALARRVLASH